MGCPDWPTCFGKWIPPLLESELPENYQQIYADRGYEHQTFNARKTWTEYLNRLVGVIVGCMVLALFALSLRLRKSHKNLFRLSSVITLSILLQGWLGAVVVNSNLLPGMISLHMLMALLIIALMILLIVTTKRHLVPSDPLPPPPKKLYILAWAVFALITIQILLGTQVREMVDTYAQLYDRSRWVDLLSGFFYIHRSLSWFLLAAHLLLLWKFYQSQNLRPLYLKLQIIGTILLTIQITNGIVLNHWQIPPYIQPLHLLTASIIFGLYLVILTNLAYDRNNKQKEWHDQLSYPKINIPT